MSTPTGSAWLAGSGSRLAKYNFFKRVNWGRVSVFSVPTLWLAVFFFIPFLVVFKISLSETAIAIPPYTALLDWNAEDALISLKLNLGNYLFLFEDTFYLDAYLSSVKIAAVSTFFTLLIAFPIAYQMARSQPATRALLLSLVILPFWTSFLLRVYAWMGFLKKNGLVNEFLMGAGIIDQPLIMLQTDFAVYIGIVYTYLPFMVLPLYSALEKMDMTLLEAAEDLGARPVTSFFLITVPLAVPGIIAGCVLVFIPAVGEFVIPALLGGSDTLMIGRVLWDEFFLNRDWPMASAVAIVMLIVLVLPIMLIRNNQGKEESV
ncbi:ABC transporter permease subunit [Amphritea sp. 1_MG-2023]|uniref:ABC transporter permease subunit n=1 Tax=Amphritea sp. 1_MG-2023 TaxID=3062670 RepID=UPI0026E45395|nr:ABC transporter permease subunit [Amphritea sp. 1_MG-2023]MDO6563380.1 ABC transporter permease subunit [Amphritea sp. 1_MG-2023]